MMKKGQMKHETFGFEAAEKPILTWSLAVAPGIDPALMLAAGVLMEKCNLQEHIDTSISGRLG